MLHEHLLNSEKHSKIPSEQNQGEGECSNEGLCEKKINEWRQTS